VKALSLTQPWAWLVIHGGKDIENRRWNTKFRGRFLVHASKAFARAEYRRALECIERVAGGEATKRVPGYDELERGGIIGSVELIDVVPPIEPVGEHVRVVHAWHFTDQWGFVLRAPRPLPFTPWKGSLGLFKTPLFEP
jgi:hypothetical protein